MVFNDSFGVIEDLIEPWWMIYAMTDKYVYFVRIPEEKILSSRSVKLLTEYYHASADRVARMDINAFRNEVRSAIPPPKGRVVMLHSPPCCGGSILCRLLRSIDPTQKQLAVLGEPPVLNALALLVQLLSIESMRSITFASLRFAMRHIEKEQVVVMKVRSCCSKVVPYVHATTPSIQHLYITTKDPNVGIARLAAFNCSTFDMICKLLDYSPLLCDFFSSWRLLEPEMVRKVGPKNFYEFALAQVIGCTISYQRNLKYFALEGIYAEDLIDDPTSVMRPVLEVCGFFLRLPAGGMDWLKCAEQTHLQTSSIDMLLDDVQRMRVRLLLEYLQQDWNI